MKKVKKCIIVYKSEIDGEREYETIDSEYDAFELDFQKLNSKKNIYSITFYLNDVLTGSIYFE